MSKVGMGIRKLTLLYFAYACSRRSVEQAGVPENFRLFRLSHLFPVRSASR